MLQTNLAVLLSIALATHPSLPTESFTYDAVGNRTSSHLSATHVHDPANRLLEDDEFFYAYDANGNLTSKTDKVTSEVTTYTYDIENQLVSLVRGPLTVDYRYDGLGRRIEKNIAGAITRYLYDQEDILQLYDGSNNWKQTFFHGPLALTTRDLDETLLLLHPPL